MRMEFDAEDFAVGYRSVAVASTKQDVWQALNRTVLFEVYDSGVRLVASDGHMLMVSWIPRRDDHEVPGVDEIPDETLLVSDPNGRAKGLLAYAQGLQRQLCAVEDDPDDAERLSLMVETGRESGTLDGFGARTVTLSLAALERLTLEVSDLGFPDWRASWFGFEAGESEHLAVHQASLEQTAKVSKITGSPIGFEFGQPATRFVAVNGEPSVEGLLFPGQWDLGENRSLSPDIAVTVDGDDWESTVIDEIVAGLEDTGLQVAR